MSIAHNGTVETTTPRTLPEPCAQALRVILATLQAAHPHLADALGRANAVLIEGRLFPGAGGEAALVRSQDGTAIYAVTSPRENPHAGTCDCPSHEKVCKHRTALRLWQHVQKRLEETTPPAPGTSVERRFIQTIKGKDFIKYEGLLVLAHTRGLASLTARIEFHSETLVLASATATFADGRRFTEWGDATPDNVAAHIKPHFPRLALTRAKARCLRDALNIAMVAVEELAE